MKSSHKRGGSAEEESGSKHPNAKMKAKLRPNATRMKKQSDQGTSAIGDVHQSKRINRNLKQDNNHGSLMTLFRLYPDMTDHQRQMVDGAGFGGLLNCCCSQVFPDLCQWLLECYDPESSELVFHGRGSIPITEATVHRVMGIPMGTATTKCEIDTAATSFMLGEFGLSKGSQPNISWLSAMFRFT